MWQSLARRWRSLGIVWTLTVLVSLTLAACAPQMTSAPTVTATIPRYQHIFLLVMENHSYDDIIGSSRAPHLNALANQYGLATNYWGVTHPSEPNYVAMIGGSYFGISNDNSYKQNALKQPSLANQLETARLTWKSYQEALPAPGYTGETATTGGDVYASKHNPFMNFLPYYPSDQRAAALANIVPASQLATDLANGSAPNFSFISPGLCTDMHGDPACADNSNLISAGDTYAYNTVNKIMDSSLWTQGNNAIIITWDEADGYFSFGPSNITSGGGKVATIVITSHGPRGVQDSTAYNHYSLLLSIEDAFGLDCLQHSCPTSGGVQPMGTLLTA